MSDTQDLFPTRLERKLGMFKRIDPVVYGDESQLANGPLSKSEIDEYEKKGFLSFEGFLTPMICRLFFKSCANMKTMLISSSQKALSLSQDVKRYAPFLAFMMFQNVFSA